MLFVTITHSFGADENCFSANYCSCLSILDNLVGTMNTDRSLASSILNNIISRFYEYSMMGYQFGNLLFIFDFS